MNNSLASIRNESNHLEYLVSSFGSYKNAVEWPVLKHVKRDKHVEGFMGGDKITMILFVKGSKLLIDIIKHYGTQLFYISSL